MLFGLKENEPIPGMAVCLLPQDQLNSLWCWQFIFSGTVPVQDDETGHLVSRIWGSADTNSKNE